MTPAQSALVEQWLGLVLWVARRFFAAHVPEDAIAAGRVGLVRAALKFNPARGVQFKSYAIWWIRAHLFNYLFDEMGGAVRYWTTREQRRVFFGYAKARQRLGDDPDAIAAELEVDRATLDEVLARLRRQDVSIDDETDERTPPRLTGGAPSPEEAVAAAEAQAQLEREVRAALRGLDARERLIVEQRHLRDRARTLAHLARQLGLSRERVRQLEQRAFTKLRRRLQSADEFA
jgi:RNA polymerase sigma-32 factor